MAWNQCKYRVCKICGKELPLTREYYRRSGVSGINGYHYSCRDCEDATKLKEEWHDGLLLCHRCLQYLPENDFTPNNTTSKIRKHRRHICKKCSSDRQRMRDLNLPDDRKLAKCLRFRVLGARDRAKKNNITFSITLEYVLKLWDKQHGKCALSGMDMTFELKEGRVPTNVSIDKIDSNGGYTEGNIQLVCMACNQIKSDLSYENMYKFCKKIVETYESKNNIIS